MKSQDYMHELSHLIPRSLKLAYSMSVVNSVKTNATNLTLLIIISLPAFSFGLACYGFLTTA